MNPQGFAREFQGVHESYLFENFNILAISHFEYSGIFLVLAINLAIKLYSGFTPLFHKFRGYINEKRLRTSVLTDYLISIYLLVVENKTLIFIRHKLYSIILMKQNWEKKLKF